MDFANINLEKYKEIAKKILLRAIYEKVKNRREFEKLRNKVVKEEKSEIFHNLYFVNAYNELLCQKVIEENSLIKSFILKRAVRTSSGVAPITVLMKPSSCPGKCIYCPSDLRMPKSYMPSQPAAQRAYRQSFNPYTQVFVRLRALNMTGHNTSKVELRIIGGSFNAYSKNYQKSFVKKCLMAMNDYEYLKENKDLYLCKKRLKKSIYGVDEVNEIVIRKKTSNKKFSLVVSENEISSVRCIGINVETRPDLINVNDLKYFRELGITKVELGVQTVFDDVHKKTKRGHNIESVYKATELLKDFGFKVGYHIMPNLPFQTPKMDKDMVKILFSDERNKPDYLKIYPCVVVKNSKLYDLYKKNEYKSYSYKILEEILLDNIKNVPYYCRVDRVARDIPANEVESGLSVSNIRQVLEKKLINSGFSIQEIRFREIKELEIDLKNIFLLERKYLASSGVEYFLSFEDKKLDKLIALLRLRIPNKTYVKELKGAMIIRELHVYGTQTPIGLKSTGKQHLGFGKKLVKKAEEIAKKEGFNKLAIISGIGVREYYKKLGYSQEGSYMVKYL